jgi:hypothetical protein
VFIGYDEVLLVLLRPEIWDVSFGVGIGIELEFALLKR